MKNKQVDRLIKPALELVEEEFKKELTATGAIPGGYLSALSAFGGALIQSGALPACALYLKSSESETDKSRLIKILVKLVQEQGGFKKDKSKEKIKDKNEELLCQIIDEYERDKNLFKQRVMNATIALKLSLRTFKLKKEEES